MQNTNTISHFPFNDFRFPFFGILNVLFFLTSPVFAFYGAIVGKVSDSKNNPVIGAQVFIEKEKIYGVTDTKGKYSIEIPEAGQFEVIYQYIGFKPETLTVTVLQGQRVEKDIVLKESAIELKEVKISARKENIYKLKTPEPITVIPQEVAERAGVSTVGAALELEPGLKLQSKCSMCNASEISIQGLPGRFSLILLDGMPVFSGLASKYTLDMFPIEFMDAIKVLKGASGAIWGSDAIAGAVNIILSKPSEKTGLKASYTYRNYGNDLSGLFSNSLKSVGITAMASRSDRRLIDLNGDSVSENTGYTRDVYLTSMKISPSRSLDLKFGASFADETRKAGSMVSNAEQDTNLDFEKVSTQRWDIWHSSQLSGEPVGSENKFLKLKLAFSSHNEDGTIEMTDYLAKQKTLYSEFSGELKNFVTGISLSQKSLSDTRLFDSYNEGDWGVWSSMRNQLGNAEFFNAGRIDFNSDYGKIFSPYSAVKFLLFGINCNLAVGTGFRTPSIVFESVQNLPAGYRYAIRKDANLSKESSVSLQAGFNKKIILKDFVSDVKLNFFRQQVSNFINTNFEGIDSATGRAIFYYYNLDEIAISTGAELSTAFMVSENIDITLGSFLLSPESGDGKTLPFINQWGANYSATYKRDNSGWEFNVAGRVNGSMLVQTVHEDSSVRSSNSPVYTTLNLRVVKNLTHFSKLILGMNNVLNYCQPPLTHGETEYYWGPIIGREFYIKISLDLGGSPSQSRYNRDKAQDPVCGMEIDKKTSLKVEYQKETYYFCSQSCKDSFLKEPEKYIKKQ